jgi:1,4-dihydroxy-2-naphthoyl-CoA synthase
VVRFIEEATVDLTCCGWHHTSMRKQQWCDASFVDEAPGDPDKRNLAAAGVAVDACFASADYVEGRTAFIEKRKPAFRGW